MDRSRLGLLTAVAVVLVGAGAAALLAPAGPVAPRSSGPVPPSVGTDSLALRPLDVLEDPPPAAPVSTAAVSSVVPWERVCGAIPAVSAPEPGEGWALLGRGEALLPPATDHVLRRDLSALLKDPFAPVSEATLAWADAASPALDLWSRAARASGFEPPAGAAPQDPRPRSDLALASLLRARRSRSGGSPAVAAQAALEVLAVGQRVARARARLEAASAVAFGRTARTLLERSIAEDGWSDEEAAWLARGLRPLVAGAPTEPAGLPAGPGLSEDPLVSSMKKEADALRRLLDAVEARCGRGGAK